jgi:hypothetical protein
VNSTLSQENRERRDRYQSAKARHWWAFRHYTCWFLRPWERVAGAGGFEPQDGELGSAALIIKFRPIEQQSCSELTGFRA